MGLYDRDYGRHETQPGIHVSSPQTVTTKLVLVTLVIYGLQVVLGSNFVTIFQLNSDWYTRPWQFFELLTYGFLHSPHSFEHILWNMFGLWIFGRDVEYRYGRQEYVSFYLSAIVISGLVWSICQSLAGEPAVVVGASGGVSAVLILFALTYPQRTVLFMFVFPMPMWVLACIIVGMDLMGAVGATELRGGNVAFTAHLAGAAFALVYFKTGWSPGRWLTGRLKGVAPRKKPKLRIHEPDFPSAETDQRVDDILQKIQAEGQESLTRRERRILEKASKEYQRKRK